MKKYGGESTPSLLTRDYNEVVADLNLLDRKGDVNEAAVGVPGVDFKVEEEANEKGAVNKASAKGTAHKSTKGAMPQQTYIVPFQPDLATVKTVPQKAKAISDWILSAIGTSSVGIASHVD